MFSPRGAPTLDKLVTFARRSEALGFDSLWVADHYLVAQPSYRVAFLDPLQVLASIAAVSGRLRIGTAVLLLPLRQPVLLAKEIATLDWLSSGRFEFGVGSGWHLKEFEGLGISMEERGRRTDEYLDVMIKLWTQDETSFHGRFVNFDGMRLLPKPMQKPHPPLSIEVARRWRIAPTRTPRGSPPTSTAYFVESAVTRAPGKRPRSAITRYTNATGSGSVRTRNITVATHPRSSACRPCISC